VGFHRQHVRHTGEARELPSSGDGCALAEAEHAPRRYVPLRALGLPPATLFAVDLASNAGADGPLNEYGDACNQRDQDEDL
jgi:hypothetical protein